MVKYSQGLWPMVICHVFLIIRESMVKEWFNMENCAIWLISMPMAKGCYTLARKKNWMKKVTVFTKQQKYHQNWI